LKSLDQIQCFRAAVKIVQSGLFLRKKPLGDIKFPNMNSESAASLRSIYTGGVEKRQPKPNTHIAGPALRFVAAALIVRDGEVLIGQRRADQPMGQLWEFPGGKIEPGESPQQALTRELAEELGIRAEVGPPVTRIRHHYRHGGAVDLQFFWVRAFTGEIDNQIYQQVRWVQLRDLLGYEFLAADRGLIKDLAEGKLL